MKFKRSKYSNVKVNGYDSKKEYNRSVVLKQLEKQGLISDLREQVTISIAPAFYHVGTTGKSVCIQRELKYIADFVYTENGKQIIEDVKGYKTAVYKKKKRLLKALYGIEIKEI